MNCNQTEHTQQKGAQSRKVKIRILQVSFWSKTKSCLQCSVVLGSRMLGFVTLSVYDEALFNLRP